MSVTDVLTADQINGLRDRWNAYKGQNGGRSILEVKANDALAGYYAAPMSYITPSGDFFYGPSSRFFGKERERERCLIAIACSMDNSGATFLPMHLFWGLMEGLAPDEIGDTLALAGLYSGLEHYTDAAKEFLRVLTAIKTGLDPGYKAPDQPPANSFDVITGLTFQLSH